MTHTLRGQIAVQGSSAALANYKNASNRNRDKIGAGLQMGEDFPYVCDRCLGDNPFMRMIKLPNYDACKITKKPFTVFKWRPSRKSGRFNRTICSYEIAAEKNICQCCLNDLTYGVPVALRDQFVKSQGALASQRLSDVPTSETNQSYYFQQKLANKDNKLLLNDSSEDRTASDYLLDVARDFNERQTEASNKEQDKLLAEINDKKKKIGSKKNKEELKTLLEKAPKDETITTLFLSNISGDTSEDEIKEALTLYGTVTRIYMLIEKKSCFVEFSTREEAERAAFNINNKIFVKGSRVKVSWAFQHDPYHERAAEKREIAELLMKRKEELGEENAAKRRKFEETSQIPGSWELFSDLQLKGTLLEQYTKENLSKTKDRCMTISLPPISETLLPELKKKNPNLTIDFSKPRQVTVNLKDVFDSLMIENISEFDSS